MMKVSEAKNFGVIPKDYWDIISDKCSCGSDFYISSNRKTLACSNVRCYVKLAYRGADMLESLGVKGVSTSYCSECIEQNKYTSHLGILIGGAEQQPKTMGWSLRENVVGMIRYQLAKPMSFRVVVSKLGLPGLKENALTLFKGVDSYEHYYNILLEYRRTSPKTGVTLSPLLQFVGGQLGSYGDSSKEIVKTLIEFDRELKIAGTIFNLVPDSKLEYNVAVTGSIVREKSLTRTQFEDYLRELGQGIVSVRVSKALASVDYVIADSPSNSATYNTGKSRGVLIESDKFCDIIREEVSKWV